jgi:2-succinyl-5-enolpyruvyl-6-hydroxy-3-cyclohexene-1-carboxylate synthase
MAVLQSIVDLVDILVKHGLTDAVICPGSRSAALTLSLARNSSVRTTISMDERAAGFLALGMAIEQKRPVVLVCTSGTAAYNFAPAVAEAFFQHIPLIILTADRPKEWIHQEDGQTIYQNGLFGKHVKFFQEFPTEATHSDSLWFANRISNELYLSATTSPPGPVHLNVPIREPFYPSSDEQFVPGTDNRLIQRLSAQTNLTTENWHYLQKQWEGSEKILIAGGQSRFSSSLTESLAEMTEEWEIPVLGDVTANLGNHPDFLSMQDLILQSEGVESLRPNLLITFGRSFLSKKFKNFIRSNPPRMHWHIGLETHLIDSFQTLSLQIPIEPDYFFQKMRADISFTHSFDKGEIGDSTYKRDWLRRELLATRVVNESMGNDLRVLDDLTCIQRVVSHLPSDTKIHLGNSMTVRHANLLRRLGLENEVWANRGTSGIDGCVSTAIGAALAGEGEFVLFVGDVSFLYDRNGFLIEALPTNLKIVVVNNGGGNIFRMIDGPRQQPELNRFFETRHPFSAQRTAEDAGIAYLKVSTAADLETVGKQFAATSGPVLLELITDPNANVSMARQITDRYKGAFQHL